MHRISVGRAAQTDIRDALNWYNHIQTHLRVRLADDIDGLLDRLGQWPLQFPVILRDVRRAVLNRFPYALYFFIEPETVVVIAFLHTSRNPTLWQTRR
jgi:plasmid stabilization system protein ParE